MKKTLVFFFCSLAAFAQKPAFTLEQVLSNPFPTELTAAPTGGKVAWVQNAKGVRNIWLAQPPDYQGKQLTSFSQDDGKEISQLRWSPDARTLLFVRGGGTRGSEPPNPAHDPAGPELAIYKLNTDGGQPAKLTDGGYPTVSPKGDSLVFLRRGQVFITALDGKEARQLMKTRGGVSQLRWSPDGTKLAFVSNRGDHSFIGVYDFRTRNLRYLSPSVDTDNSPVWSPDGKQVAFVRIAAADDAIFGPVREAEPWSIVVADAETGRGKTLWKANEGMGSAYREIVADNQIQWTAGNYIIFPWERDGWTHLYSIPAQGGVATLLTPGNFEVEYVTLTNDKKEILFNSNQGDIDRRHVWRVGVTDNIKPVAVTQGRGIEWAPVMLPDNKTVAVLCSDARRPARAALVASATQLKDLAPNVLPTDFPVNQLVEPQAVTLSAVDGMPIPAQLFLPPNLKKGDKRPAVIFFHGGSRRQMLLGWNYGAYYHHAYALNQYFAALGYVVLSVNYRSGIGYGMAFREAVNYGEAGGSEFNDVMGAGLYLRNRPDVDGNKIGLWGGSYGGYLTAMGLSRASDLFAAGVDIHGVHDWNVGIKTFLPSYNKLEFPEKARRAFEASPLSSVDTWRSPVLVIHGDDDRNVEFAETVELVKALRKRKVEVEQLIFPDEVHSFLRYANWLDCYRATVDFMERKLRK